MASVEYHKKNNIPYDVPEMPEFIKKAIEQDKKDKLQERLKERLKNTK